MKKKKPKPHLSRKSFLLFSISLVLLFAVVFIACQKNQDVEKYLQTIPQAQWQQGTVELTFKQPVDHKHPSGPKFSQRVVINHVGYDRPVVVQLEGYSLYSKRRSELAEILDANQITIEHRYFDESTPQPVNWEHLTIWQAATDHHKIINALKGLYKGKWVSTGISKGGQATMFHRRFYPDDVDASVPYVAPLNLAREDKRIHQFLDQVGTRQARQKIRRFQKNMLAEKAAFLPLFEAYAMEKDYQFTMDLERAFELTVLEYPFAFWQWGHVPVSNIPREDDPVQERFDHLVKVSSPDFFAEEGIKEMRPFFYQAMSEIGMYDYRYAPFHEYLDDTTNITFEHTMADSMEVAFDSTAMRDVHDWLKKHGNQMMYIYGEQDPWSATAFTPSEKTDAVKFVNPGGSHRTRIKSFPLTMQDSIYTVLEKWLDVDIDKEIQ